MLRTPFHRYLGINSLPLGVYMLWFLYFGGVGLTLWAYRSEIFF